MLDILLLAGVLSALGHSHLDNSILLKLLPLFFEVVVNLV